MIGTRYLCKLFDRFSVAVTGSKGSGKDVLMGNVIARRKEPYASNMDYTHDKKYHPLDLSKLDCGHNTYADFISGDVKKYVHPYPEKCDVYISDAGIYFPSQYNGELNQRYKYYPTLCALTRQINDSSIHYNAQAYGRVWDKIREQCDWYIRCRSCTFIGKLVILRYTEYDKADSCQNRVQPQRLTRTGMLTHKREKMTESVARDQFRNTYGLVRNRIAIFINKSKHDTRKFKELLENGKTT